MDLIPVSYTQNAISLSRNLVTTNLRASFKCLLNKEYFVKFIDELNSIKIKKFVYSGMSVRLYYVAVILRKYRVIILFYCTIFIKRSVSIPINISLSDEEDFVLYIRIYYVLASTIGTRLCPYQSLKQINWYAQSYFFECLKADTVFPISLHETVFRVFFSTFHS